MAPAGITVPCGENDVVPLQCLGSKYKLGGNVSRTIRKKATQ